MGAQDRGWGHPSTQREAITHMQVRGVDFPGGVNERVETVMGHLAAQFHERVESLRDGWCWGYAYRYIAGTTTWSNHAWGLAVDINAPRHPYGESGTFSPSQARECRRIADEHGCRWGGDYSSTPDEMHFEYMGTPAEADDLTRALTGDGPRGHRRTDWFDPEHMMQKLPHLQRGAGYDDQGQGYLRWYVMSAQALLNARLRGSPCAVDGYYGPNTDEQVRVLQRREGVGVDGIVGPVTWRQLLGDRR